MSTDRFKTAIPILKQGQYLIASIQSSLTDDDLLELRDRLGHEIGENRSSGVIIDLTAIDILDSFATRILQSIAHATRLRGADTVVVGIQPEVAFTMVQLGLTLEGITTALDFDDGINALRQRHRTPPDA